MSRALCIGLTGGIGSGKTEASREFSRLGATVIDTDLIARQLVEPGQTALSEIRATFGEQVIGESGKLDRSQLRQAVFYNAEQRKKLEHILHPRIRERAVALADQAETPYCVLVIPLLVESVLDYSLDRILVIDTPRELQYQRVAARDAVTTSEIDAILATQVSREKRLAVADDVVVNDSDLNRLHNEIERLHHFYLRLARGRI
ncbi:MAG: dephospho-CoA kinase [Thiogranum sp.]